MNNPINNNNADNEKKRKITDENKPRVKRAYKTKAEEKREKKAEEKKEKKEAKKRKIEEEKKLRDDKKEAKKRKIEDEKKIRVDKIAESNRKIRAGEKEKQLKKRKIDNKKKVWVDKIAESNRKIRAGEKEKQLKKRKRAEDKKQKIEEEKTLQEQKKTKKAKETADRKALQEENKNEQDKLRDDKNALTVLNPDGKTFEICDDHEVNEINKFRTDMLVSEEETGGLSRVIDEDGTDLSPHGIYKLKKVYPEDTAVILTGEMDKLDRSEFSTPGSPTSTVQIVGFWSQTIKPEKLGPRLAHRIKVSKSGKFGKTIARTDNLKVQKYKGPGGKHRDHKFTHIMNRPGIPKSSFLAARVLEKPDGGSFNWLRESDGKEFLIEIKKGELLILMAHAGLCNHNSQEGLFTIVTDFVLPYDAIRREREGGLDGKFE